MGKGLLPDTHPQCAGAARSTVLAESDVVMLIGARLNWLLSHGKGKAWGDRSRRSSSRSTSSRRRWTPTSRSPRRWSATSAPASRRCSKAWAATGRRRRPTGSRRSQSKRDENVAKMAPRLMNNNVPMDYHGALGVLRTIVKERPDAILVNEGANTLDLARGIIDMYQPRKRLDVGTWGIMGIGMGYAIAAAIETGKPVLAVEGDSRVRLLRHGGGDDLPLQAAGLHRHLQQRRHLSRHRRQQGRASDPAPTVFVKGARYDKMMEAFGGVGVNATSPGRAQARRQRGDGLRQADAHQRGDRSGGRQRERPHRQPQSAKRAAQEDSRQSGDDGRRIEDDNAMRPSESEAQQEGATLPRRRPRCRRRSRRARAR